MPPHASYGHFGIFPRFLDGGRAGDGGPRAQWIRQGVFQHQAAPRRGPSAECEDFNVACKGWAAEGECEKNPHFMLGTDGTVGQCRESCGACPYPKRSSSDATRSPGVTQPGGGGGGVL